MYNLTLNDDGSVTVDLPPTTIATNHEYHQLGSVLRREIRAVIPRDPCRGYLAFPADIAAEKREAAAVKRADARYLRIGGQPMLDAANQFRAAGWVPPAPSRIMELLPGMLRDHAAMMKAVNRETRRMDRAAAKARRERRAAGAVSSIFAPLPFDQAA